MPDKHRSRMHVADSEPPYSITVLGIEVRVDQRLFEAILSAATSLAPLEQEQRVLTAERLEHFLRR